MSEQEYIDGYIDNLMRAHPNSRKFTKVQLKSYLLRVLDDKSGLYIGTIKSLERDLQDERDTVKALKRMLTNILDGHLPPCVSMGGDD